MTVMYTHLMFTCQDSNNGDDVQNPYSPKPAADKGKAPAISHSHFTFPSGSEDTMDVDDIIDGPAPDNAIQSFGPTSPAAPAPATTAEPAVSATYATSASLSVPAPSFAPKTTASFKSRTKAEPPKHVGFVDEHRRNQPVQAPVKTTPSVPTPPKRRKLAMMTPSPLRSPLSSRSVLEMHPSDSDSEFSPSTLGCIYLQRFKVRKHRHHSSATEFEA